MVAAQESNTLVRFHTAADDSADGNLADILIGFERRNHHLQRTICITRRGRNVLDDGFQQGDEVVTLVFHVVLRNAFARRCVDAREVQLLIVCIKLHEKLKNFIINIIDTLIGAINLVDDDDGFEFLLKRLS